jgi:hypothetical protein
MQGLMPAKSDELRPGGAEDALRDATLQPVRLPGRRGVRVLDGSCAEA